MEPALLRYRVMAYVVGVMLLILVFVAVPLRYLFDTPEVSAVVSPLHGFLYAVYLLAVLSLGTRSQWTFRKTILVMLGGTVPFLSFWLEHRITDEVRAQLRSGALPTSA
ncbi:MAG: DUF3817 domain-containing protein [Geodermatophilaceae bacterium]|nr:DUF3817 domain-containing protein [Geodermatophilaceae bacterium]